MLGGMNYRNSSLTRLGNLRLNSMLSRADVED